MEWMGFIALLIFLSYSSYPGKVKKLEKQVAKLEKQQRGDSGMSKIIHELIGKSCKIKTGEVIFAGNTEILCTVLDADEEWIKISYTDKKNHQVTRILRIDSIENVEMMDR